MNQIERLQEEDRKLKRENEKYKRILIEHNLINTEEIPFYHKEDKLRIYKNLFKGREDVYALNYKETFFPACKNRISGRLCKRKKNGSKWCRKCSNQNFSSLTDFVLLDHISTSHKRIGLYPLLKDNTCFLLAIDFDEDDWFSAMLSVYRLAKRYGIDSAMERSFSGNGGHLWFFFQEPIPAYMARMFGRTLLNEAMRINKDITYESYDRLFPAQDTMPEGGFGNLIALPFAFDALMKGNAVFINEYNQKITKQFYYLSTIKKIFTKTIENYINQNKEMTLENLDIDTNNLNTIHIKRTGILKIEKKGLNSHTIQFLRKISSMWNPEYFRKQRNHEPLWKGNGVSAILSEYEETENYIYLPRALDEIIEEHTNIIYDDHISIGHPIDVSFIGKLYSYQQEAITNALKHSIGVIKAPTGSGKTVMALNIVAQLKVSTLIILGNTELAKQWKKRINDFLDYPDKDKKRNQFIGEYSGSKKKMFGNIDIALVQSLSHLKDKEIFERYGLVIIDEGHHSASTTYRETLKNIPAKNIYSFTATPERQDGLDKIVSMYLGRIVSEVPFEVIKTLRHFKQILIPRYTTFTYLDEDHDFTNIVKKLVNNQKRNNEIIQDVIHEYNKSRNIIVLSDRIEHLDYLYERIKHITINSFLLTGKTKVREKNRIIETVNRLKDENYILLASYKLIGEGFDLPSLETMFMASPFSWKGRTSQYIGRLHRNHEGKEVIKVYDYVDRHVEMLKRMYQNRLKVYRSEGYDIQINNNKIISLERYLYEYEEYQKNMINNICAAHNEIVISCNTIYLSRIKSYYKMIEGLVMKGIHVHLFTDIELTKEIISYLHSLGVHLRHTLHPSNLVIIDKKIIWLSNSSFFGYQDKLELAYKLNDPSFAEELLSNLITSNV
jgi:superfamily II DNA or RNA helicase